MDRFCRWRDYTNISFVAVVHTEGAWFLKLQIFLNLVIVISGVKFVVKFRILRYTLDWNVARLGYVPNEPGIDIHNINCVIPDLLDSVRRESKYLVILDISEDVII